MNNNLVWRVGRKPTYVSLSSKMKTLVALVLMPMGALALELNPSFAPEAVAKYRERADAGDAEAQYLYSEALASGEGIAKNPSKAMEYAQKAAAQGFGLAFRRVGVGYEKGWGVVSNVTEATKWYGKFLDWAKPEAEKGNAHAQFNIGQCCYWGGGVAEDKAEAVRWYRKAAEQGYAVAQFRMSLCYSEGWGVEKDEKEAVEWLRKAAEQGRTEAQYLLGVSYVKGRGVEKDEKEAVEWYRKAAEQGLASAQYVLGLRYAKGCGVAKDEKEAIKWYRKAAEQGDADAQLELAGCYAEGKGVTSNYEEAVKWYCKAADQDEDRAQFKLGQCYAQGVGVPHNDEEAVKWYRKAAERGNAEAQLALGRYYYKGVGVARNRVKAVRCVMNGMWQVVRQLFGYLVIVLLTFAIIAFLTMRFLRRFHIRGWFAIFVLYLVVGVLWGVIGSIAICYAHAWFEGVWGVSLGMTDIMGFVLCGVIKAVVSAWTVVLICRQSPTAIFWAKYLMIVEFLLSILFLLCLDEGLWFQFCGAIGAAAAIIWFLYLAFSNNVRGTIPKSSRKVGVWTWILAFLLSFLLMVCMVDVDAVYDEYMASRYHDYVEIQQSELSTEELTDGHIVFGRIKGWSYEVVRNDNGVNVCSLANGDESCIMLYSALCADDSVECFSRIVEEHALAIDADFEKQGRQMARDDKDVGNGVTRYYRVMRYDSDDGLIFQHDACLFDRESRKVAIVVGYFHEKEVPDFERLLQTVRFKK